jgi:hypothetical protein
MEVLPLRSVWTLSNIKIILLSGQCWRVTDRWFMNFPRWNFKVCCGGCSSNFIYISLCVGDVHRTQPASCIVVAVIMVAHLSVCTKGEQVSVIRFLLAEAVPGAEIHHRCWAQYGNNALQQRNMYEWITGFKNRGRICWWRKIRSLVHIEYKEIHWMRQCHGSAGDCRWSAASSHAIIQDRLRFQNVCARWVPQQFTREVKRKFW